MLERTSLRAVTTSWPATRALPPVGCMSVHSTEIVVVLPAPLGPRKPNSSPGSTENEMPSTAVKSPKRLTRPSTSTALEPAPFGKATDVETTGRSNDHGRCRVSPSADSARRAARRRRPTRTADRPGGNENVVRFSKHKHTDEDPSASE